MIQVTADVSGLERLIKDLDGKGGEEIVAAMAQEILDGASERVPVQSGDLKRSGRTEKRKGTTHAVIFGGKEAPHAVVVHEGASFQPKTGTKRFLRDSAMDSKRVLAAAAKAARKVIERTR